MDVNTKDKKITTPSKLIWRTNGVTHIHIFMSAQPQHILDRHYLDAISIVRNSVAHLLLSMPRVDLVEQAYVQLMQLTHLLDPILIGSPPCDAVRTLSYVYQSEQIIQQCKLLHSHKCHTKQSE